MKKVQQGFTLIELMIVVAIIGILAAIAIPQYQDYVTRAKWQDNIARVASFKQAIAECVQNNNGDLTLCDTEAEVTTATGVPAISGLAASTNFASAAYAAGAMTITGTAAVSSCTVTMTPTLTGAAIVWGYTNGGGCTKTKTGVGA